MKVRWLLAALVTVILIYVAWILLSKDVAIDACLDGGGAWRADRCVH